MRKEVASADFSGEEGEDALGAIPGEEEPATLDRVFSALADPVRRISCDASMAKTCWFPNWPSRFGYRCKRCRGISRCWCVGTGYTGRTGRISRCRLDAGPIYQAAVWVNRYSKYWREQFNFMAAWLGEIDRERSTRAKKSKSSKRSRVVRTEIEKLTEGNRDAIPRDRGKTRQYREEITELRKRMRELQKSVSPNASKTTSLRRSTAACGSRNCLAITSIYS